MVESAALLPGLAMDASAVETSVTAYSEENNTVTIQITPEAPEVSDFVTEFPQITPPKVATARNFAEELADQERKEFVSVPLYFQTDYPDVIYGSGTVESVSLEEVRRMAHSAPTPVITAARPKNS